MKPIASCAMGLTLLLVVAGIPAKAQNQTPSGSETTASGQSLGSYARQVRKSPETGNKPKVFDNDNLPKSDHLSIVGKPQAPANEQPQTEAKTENAPPRLRAKPRTKPNLLARKRLPRAKLLKMRPLSRRRGNSGATRSDRSSSRLTCCRANSTCCNGSTRSAPPPCMPMPATGSAIRPIGTSRIPSTNSRSRTSKKQWTRPRRSWKTSRKMRAKLAPPLLFRSSNEFPERQPRRKQIPALFFYTAITGNLLISPSARRRRICFT